MRTISELLTILRDNARVENDSIFMGLCFEIGSLLGKIIITTSESIKLKIYIQENMPVRMLEDEIGGHVASPYGWPPGEWTPRLAWLNEHIELTKDKQQ